MRQLKIQVSITNRSSDSLNKYLIDVSKTNMVSADEEVILAQKIRAGDQSALNRLTNANLRFVISVAKQYQNMGLPLGDLICEGNLGLIKAARRFDETKGFKFISYAVWWIRQSIMSAVADNSRVVRLPANQVAMIKNVNKMFSRLEQTLGRTPSLEEIADEMEVPAERIADVMSKSAQAVSLDAPFPDQEQTYLDLLSSPDSKTDETLIKESLTTLVRQSLNTLNERERNVLIMYFGIGCEAMSLKDIGYSLGITHERVRQLKTVALSHMKGHHSNAKLRLLLDGQG